MRVSRDKWTQIVNRMLQAIEQDHMPARIRELHVFGSYARGALEPHDLDLIVIHNPPDAPTLARLKAQTKGKGRTWLEENSLPERRFKAAIKNALRKPGERIDLILDTDIKNVDSCFGEAVKDRILIWSEKSRNWKVRLKRIKPDPHAGRAPRKEILPVKRAGCDRQTMEEITGLVQSGQIQLTRIPVDQIRPNLLPYFEALLARKREYSYPAMGKDTMAVLPYAFWWLGRKQVIDPSFDRNWILDPYGRFEVQIGRLYFHRVIHLFHDARMRQQCLIPHFKKTEPNELLVFARGKQWKPQKLHEPVHRKRTQVATTSQSFDVRLEGDLLLTMAFATASGRDQYQVHFQHRLNLPSKPNTRNRIKLEYDRLYSSDKPTPVLILRPEHVVAGPRERQFFVKLKPLVKEVLDPVELVSEIRPYKILGFRMGDKTIVRDMLHRELPTYEDVRREWKAQEFRAEFYKRVLEQTSNSET